MAQLVSPAFQGLNCLICGQQAHGQRFGAVSCLPCASFFRQFLNKKKKLIFNKYILRRYVIEKWNHKCARGYKCMDNPNIGVIRNCKACRFRRCQNAGMKIKLRNSDDDNQQLIQEYDQNNNNNLFNFPQLESLKLNFEEYLKSQNKLFSLIYPKLVQQQISIIIPESEENIFEFENRSKQFLLEMLNKSFNCFNELNMQQKLCLFNDCFDQINLLISTYLTIKNGYYLKLKINIFAIKRLKFLKDLI
ncbi:Nuclear receptor domain-containing protein [Meloidogyne graminicola]|uniref:Nuclear receptor domain-containing protein n=1 Tax=Meloidogyne graminicola TaxID=189291 RepID=A0A8T0A0Q6_9BILA|nr:Nuclear receptor domain-containing protein [Meloidogyne graminicola]